MSERKPLFLAKVSYRSRRLGDAARLLPVVAAFLMVLPAMWSEPGSGLSNLSETMVYVFGVWAALILCAALIARRLMGLDAAGGGTQAGREADQGPEA